MKYQRSLFGSLLCLMCSVWPVVWAFGAQPPGIGRGRLAALSAFNDKEDKNDNNQDDPGFRQSLNSRVDQINVETTREQLEDAHTQSFLKRRPLKLRYHDARLWVQANLGCDTEEEFNDLVANGNLRTPYIPKSPKEYYTATREWISWEHFLRGCFDNCQPSAVQPSTGVFD